MKKSDSTVRVSTKMEFPDGTTFFFGFELPVKPQRTERKELHRTTNFSDLLNTLGGM